LTKPIEEAVGTVSGIRNIWSISREGVSLVFAEFGWEQDMDRHHQNFHWVAELISHQHRASKPSPMHPSH